VGPAHGGVEFLEGALPGIERYAIGQMTKSRREKLYIDDAGWGPEDDSIESGYQVPFGKIHVFIGTTGESGPESGNTAGSVETARRAQPGQARADRIHAFVGFTQGVDLANNSMSGGDTLVYSDGESSVGDTESILPLFDEKLGGYSDDEVFPESYEPTRLAAVYMEGN
jgi:hypothetical protein